jgi:SAM-dependent methyltransferase
VTGSPGDLIQAHLEHPDTLPATGTFVVQGWVLSRERVLSAFVEGRGSVRLELRARADVEKVRPDAPHAVGFLGTAPLDSVSEGKLDVRFVFATTSLVQSFPLPPESPEALAARAARRERVYRTLRCVACHAPFPAAGYAPGQASIRCAACGKSYDSKNGQFDLISDGERGALARANPGEVSKNAYDARTLEFIGKDENALILDCGAGFRPVEYPNVVNLEIVPYPTTDVLGTNSELPFVDGAFDGVISIAVLEHVRNPLASAREITRVLKPGGRLLAVVPLLAPVHAFPDHYFNMTAQGLASLFAPDVEILDASVPESGLPIWALVWMLRSWAEGLPQDARHAFSNLRVGELFGEGHEYLDRDFVRELPREKNFELAATTQILGRKR